MPKPVNKKELLDDAEATFNALLDLISIQEDIHTTFLTASLNRNIRDVLAHVHHWHTLFETWYLEGMRGEKPAMPAPGYRWVDTPKLNVFIWDQYQTTAFETIFTAIKNSHKHALKIIQQHTNDELFTKRYYPWTGSTSLGAYLISNTSAHYRWAIKVIKNGIHQPFH